MTCEPATQRTRLASRGTSLDDAARRIAAQGALVARLRPHVTRVLRTDGPAGMTEERAAALFAAALAAHIGARADS